MTPEIRRITCTEFSYPLENVAPQGRGGGVRFSPGDVTQRRVFAVRIETNEGIDGEYIASHSPPDVALAQVKLVADHLIGKNPLERERHWSELQRALRKYDRMGIGPIDIALWDFAGKYHKAPIHELLGSYRQRLPAYASTYMGDTNGGLDSPEAYADFAEQCLELGYPAFKIHGWGPTSDGKRDIDREIETVLAVGKRVSDEMDVMLDPACEYETFSDALKVGRACDEAEYLWYEDPYRDGGLSQHGHRKLREFLDTPILEGEHVRGLPLITDFIANEATDFVRADPEYDGGITGAMKIARVAEGFGLDVEYHASCPARRHCMAATRNTNYYEMALVHPNSPCTRHVPAYANGYSEELTAIDEDGCVSVPNEPGLGVEYNWEYIDQHKTAERIFE